MPLTTESLTATRFPNSSAKPISCLVRGRSTAPRGAKDTLVTLSTLRPARTNTSGLLLHSLRSLRAYRAAEAAAVVGCSQRKERLRSLLLRATARDPLFDCLLRSLRITT
jgi:hypothetical protein